MRFVTEISLVQSGHIQPTSIENRLVDVYREKPIRLVVKVAVPVKEHPKVKVPILTSKISSICNVPPRMQITNKFLLCRTKKPYWHVSIGIKYPKKTFIYKKVEVCTYKLRAG